MRQVYTLCKYCMHYMHYLAIKPFHSILVKYSVIIWSLVCVAYVNKGLNGIPLS